MVIILHVCLFQTAPVTPMYNNKRLVGISPILSSLHNLTYSTTVTGVRGAVHIQRVSKDKCGEMHQCAVHRQTHTYI